MTSTPAVFIAASLKDDGVPSGTVNEGSNYDATYSIRSINPVDTSGQWYTKFKTTGGVDTTYTPVVGDSLWISFYYYSFRTPNANVVTVCDSSGNPWIAWNSTNVYINTNTGASPTWTQIGSTFSNVSSTYNVIKVTFGSPHTLTFYQSGSQITTGTATSANLSSAVLDRVKLIGVFYGGLGADGSEYSQINCTLNIGLVGSKQKTTVASGAGSNAGWTGAYTDINETTLNDSTVNLANSASLDTTYAWGDITVPSGYIVQDVWYWFRCKNDGTAPVNIAPLYKPSGLAVVAGSNLSGIGVGFSFALSRYATDPNTSAAWTQTNFNAAEFGQRSVT